MIILCVMIWQDLSIFNGEKKKKKKKEESAVFEKERYMDLKPTATSRADQLEMKKFGEFVFFFFAGLISFCYG